MAQAWEYTTDILVIGSGGGGMVAALAASHLGSKALIIEKGSVYGGSTAMSGGAMWVPNNHLMKQEGLSDSSDEGLAYLKAITGGKVPEDRMRAYVENAPEVVKWLEEHSRARYRVVHGSSDFYADAAGAKSQGGRTIEPVPFNGWKLGKLRAQIRGLHPQVLVFGRIMVSLYDAHVLLDTSMRGRKAAFKNIALYALNPMRTFSKTDTRLNMGNAAIGRLRLSLAEREVPLWLNTAAKRLIVDGGRVVGVEAEREGKSITIKADKGVIIASGGYPRNAAMRDKYSRKPISDKWTVACPENAGDAVGMGIEAGAALGAMEEAWWIPTSLVPGAPLPMMILVERSLPGSMIVNKKGKRFTNEAGPFTDIVKAQYADHAKTGCSIPAYLIVDKRFRGKYPLSPMIPGYTPKKYIENGYIKVGNTIEELAGKCGIDATGLAAELRRFNEFAAKGSDLDFHKGESPADRYFGDPAAKPNPCLGAIDTPPFYAVELWPGDIGTNGGLRTDASARVLRADGSAISGLYAAGNCADAVTGNAYPGAGATIGISMVFGYIAARHAAGSK
ncbi:MAG: FAD-binding protein [Dehalococcoidia bacterium]